jgi:hypothetical protein
LKLNYKKNPHQKEFHEDIATKILLLTSGFGAGKSYALAMKGFQLSYLNRPYDGGLVVPSIADYKKDMLLIMEDILEENRIKYTYHQTDKWFEFPWTKGRLYVASAENKIRGPNWAYALINEIGILPHGYERFKEVLGRVRIKGAKNSQIASVGTPEGKSNWVFEHFIEKERQDTKVIYGKTSDNFALHEDYIEMLKQNYDSIMLQAYLDGKFVNMNGTMFYYAFSREKNADNKTTEDKNLPVYIGMDFNVDNMTATVWHNKGQVMEAFDEIHLRDSDTNKLCMALKSRGYTPDRSQIFPDPSGNSRKTSGYADVTILKNHGYLNIKFKPKAPTFRDRQLTVNNLLDKGLIKVNPNTCKKLLKDLEGVEQDTVDFSKVKTNSDLTHASDGMDYMMDIMFPLSGKKPISQVQR